MQVINVDLTDIDRSTGEDGNIYEGRGTYKGAHTVGTIMPKEKYFGMTNSNTIGIAMLGNFSGEFCVEKRLAKI